MKAFICACFAALSLVSCASTQNPQSQTPSAELYPEENPKLKDRGSYPFQGERLKFDARHVNTKVTLAEAWLEVHYERNTDENIPHIPIIGGASSVALARLFAKIDDKFESYINPKTWEAFYSAKYLNDMGRQRDFHVWFWPENMNASVERRSGQNLAQREYSLMPSTMDSVAWIYWIRTLDPKELDQSTWYTFDGWTLNRLSLQAKGEEDVWTPLGIYHCDKYVIHRERSDALLPQGALSGVFIEPSRKVYVENYPLATAWLSKDEKRIPVRLAVKTGMGDFDLLISAIEFFEKE